MKRYILILTLLSISTNLFGQAIVIHADEFDKAYYSNDSFEATYECQAGNCPPLSVRVYVNDVLQPSQIEKGARPGKRRFTISGLPKNLSGITTVRIEFIDAEGRSYSRYSYELTYRPEDKSYSFLGIGVGDFEYGSGIKPLRWPVNDIVDVEKCFITNLDGLFSRIITNVEKAGTLGKRREILSLFNDFSSHSNDNKSSHGEIIYIYLSGHGKVGPDGEWYFFTEDTRANYLASTSISGSVIRDYVASMAARSRVYLFIDACESGALYAHTPIPSNVVFYASSRSGESSIESDFLENSAFTKALLSVFEGGYKVNEVTVKGLFNVINQIVGDATHHRQHPVLIPDNRYENDIVLKMHSQLEGVISATPVRGIVPAIMSIIPGGGQLYKNDYLKAGLMFGGSAIGAGGIVFCESRRKQLLIQASQTHDVNNIKYLSSQAQHMATARNICIGVTASICIYSIIDAAFAPGKKQKIQVIPGGIAYNF